MYNLIETMENKQWVVKVLIRLKINLNLMDLEMKLLINFEFKIIKL